MSRLAFLSPDEADVPPGGLRKLEVRGGIPEGAIAIGPSRGLVLVDGDARPERDRLTALGYRVYDLTAGLVTLEVEGEQLMRRLTDLDLSQLPAAGKLAGVQAFVFERNGEYRIFFPQEYGHSVVEVVRDVQAGLA